MHTVKVKGFGMINFRGKETRIPCEFKKVSDKELKLLKVLCRYNNVEYEILEQESDRLASVAQKIKESQISEKDLELNEVDIKIEDLFESDDAMDTLLKTLKKDEE